MLYIRHIFWSPARDLILALYNTYVFYLVRFDSLDGEKVDSDGAAGLELAFSAIFVEA